MEENTTKSEAEPDSSKEATDVKDIIEQVWTQLLYLVVVHMARLNHEKNGLH